MTNDLSLMTTGGYYTGDVPYYDTFYTYPYPYSVPYWNPPVYIQPTYVNPQPMTIVIGKIEDLSLAEEVKGLKEEIKKLRKELAKK